MDHSSHRAARPRGRCGAIGLPTLAVALALLACAALAVASVRLPPNAGLSQAAAPALTDDDGDQPMFQTSAMAPGGHVTRCLRVRLDQGAPATIALTAGTAGGALHDQLELSVDAGRGGGFDSCAGFTGVPVYRGTVQEFLLAHHSGNGLHAWTASADGEQRTFRFTIRLREQDAPQDGMANMRFDWHANSLDDPSTASAPADAAPTSGTDSREETDDGAPRRQPDGPPASVADAAPDGPPASVADAAPDGPPASVAVAAPADTAGAQAAAPTDERQVATEGARKRRDRDAGSRRGAGTPATETAATGGRPASRAPAPEHGALDRVRRLASHVLNAVAEATEAVIEAAAPAAKRAAFPLLLAFLVVAFLALQNRIDRRDPKLALAPVHRTSDLGFKPYPTEQELAT